MGEKPKVECENCNFYYILKETTTSSEYVRIKYFCDPKGTTTRTDEFISRLVYEKKDLEVCQECNENNDCKYYEPKYIWWKFWVKKIKKR